MIDALRRSGCLTALLGVFFLLSAPRAAAQDARWSLDIGAERSDVTIGANEQVWWTESAQVSYRIEGKGGLFFGIEHEDRGDPADTTGFAGGYRRLGDWTLFGQAGVTPNAEFRYKSRAEVELSRRLVGTLVGGLGYRYLRYTTSTVHQFSPVLTLYLPRGELEARGIFARGTDLNDAKATAVTVRGSWDVHERVSLAGGVSVGEGLYGATERGLPRGWIVFVSPKLRLTPKDSIGAAVTRGHEEPDFDQRAVSLYYRRLF